MKWTRLEDKKPKNDGWNILRGLSDFTVIAAWDKFNQEWQQICEEELSLIEKIRQRKLIEEAIFWTPFVLPDLTDEEWDKVKSLKKEES